MIILSELQKLDKIMSAPLSDTGHTSSPYGNFPVTLRETEATSKRNKQNFLSCRILSPPEELTVINTKFFLVFQILEIFIKLIFLLMHLPE